MKYMYLTKIAPDLYIENHKELWFLIMEKKENPNQWRDILYSWIGTFNIVKMSLSPSLIYSRDWLWPSGWLPVL